MQAAAHRKPISKKVVCDNLPGTAAHSRSCVLPAVIDRTEGGFFVVKFHDGQELRVPKSALLVLTLSAKESVAVDVEIKINVRETRKRLLRIRSLVKDVFAKRGAME